MKKRLSLLMVLVMVVSLLPLSAFAAANVVYTTSDVIVSSEDKTEEYRDVSFNLRFTDGTLAKTGKFTLEFSNGAVVKNVKLTTPGAEGAADKIVVNEPTVGNGIVGGLVFGSVTVPENLVTANQYIAVNAKLYVPNTGDVMVKVTDEGNIGLGNIAEFKVAVVKEDVTADLDIRVKEADKAVSFDGGKVSQFEIRNFKAVNADNRTLEIYADVEGGKLAATTTVIVDGVGKTGVVDATGKIVLSKAVLDGKKSIVVLPEFAAFSRKASEGELKVYAAVVESNVVNAETVYKTVTSNNAVVGKLVDYSVTLTVVEKGKKEIPSVWGGEEATVVVTVKGPKGSLLDKRTIDFKVDGAAVKVSSDAKITGDRASDKPADAEYNLYKDGEFSYSFTRAAEATEDKVSFELRIVTDADKDGVATITAAQRGWEQKADLAKITPKFQVTADATQVKKGERKATADIVLTEAKAGLLAKNDKIRLYFSTRSEYVAFVSKVTNVEATNGLKLDLDNVEFEKNNTVLVYKVTRTSSKEPAVITFKDVKVLIDGSATDSIVPVRASLNGAFVDRVDYINVVKEYALGANKSVFTVGAVAYKVDAVEKSLQVAPYIKNGRVMLPIRAVAEALGLTVQWNAATKTATFADATKIAAVVIGSDTIFVNGTPIKLSAPAELVKGTTFVELRSLASAFGVDIRWDAAAKTATVSR